MTTSAAFLIVSLISLFVAHLAATATKVLQDIQWHELKDYVRKRDKRRFDVIHDHCEEVATGTESLLFLAIAIHVFFGIAWISKSELIEFDSLFDAIVGVSTGSIVLLATLVWLPKAIAEHAGTSFLYRSWSVWQSIAKLFHPLVYGSAAANTIVQRLLGITEIESDEEALEEEIRAMVIEAQHDGLLAVDTREMIEGVIELDDANVADIMTPRDEMDVISAELGWAEVLEYVTDVGRTRIPVYNSSRNEFIGILYVKDLFSELRKPESDRQSLREILRETWSVPTTMRLDELLQQFRQTRNHLALVLDEYNTIAGLVTIEDVLEEIVGEIVDESDKEHVGEIRVISDREVEVLGRAHVADINEVLGCELPEDDEYDTISGFLMHQLGHIPKPGEHLRWNSTLITVVEASRRRAELIRIASTNESPSDLLTG